MPFHRPLGEREAKQQAPPTFVRPLNDKRAVVGERVVLECQTEGHPDPLVKWLKDGHNVSTCPDYLIESDGMKHRLVIENVQGADSGRFTAQALNTAGNKQSTCILIVAPAPTPVPGAKPMNSPAPPQTPVGPSAPIFLKELRHQPLKPGGAVVFEARVAGQPQPTVEWLKGQKPFQNYRARLEHDVKSGIVSLTIPQMFTDDVGEYTLKASNQHGTAQTQAQLLPREQYDRWFTDEQHKLTRDRKQHMLAQSGSGTGRPASAALRQMAKYGQHGFSDTESLTWGVSESETEPELAALDPRGAPGTRPLLRTPLRGLRLTEGTDAILQASIVGNPKPKIAWYKNGQALVISGPRMQVTYKNSLAVLKVSMVVPEDSGEYTILAENRYGKVDSSARIEVYPLNVPDERPLLTPNTQPTTPVLQEAEQRRRHEEEQAELRREQVSSQQSAYEDHIRQRQQQGHPAQRQLRLNYAPAQRQGNVEQEQQQWHERQQLGHHYNQQQQHATNYEMAARQQQVQQQQQQAQNGTVKEAAFTDGYSAPSPGQMIGRSSKPPVFVVHPQSVAAKIGDEVVFSAKAAGDPLPQMEWLRADGSTVPQKGAVRAEGFADGSGRLTIDKVEAELGGTYLCVVRNAGGSAQSRFQLNVLQTRSPDAPKFTGTFQSTTINEGDTIKLYCKATGDGLKFEWNKDNYPIGSGGKYKVSTSANETTLIIEGATLEEGGWYTCVASNQYGSTPLKGRIVVQSRKRLAPHQRELITLRKVDHKRARTPVNQLEQASSQPPQFSGKLQPLSLVEGQAARLEIAYSPAEDPNLRVAWLKDGKALLASSRVATQAEFGQAILEIHPINVFDQGEYTVVAVNTAGEAKVTTNLQVLGHAQVSASPRPQEMGQMYSSVSGALPEVVNFHSELRSQEVFEGHPIHLECKLTPINDPSLRVEWLLNGQPLAQSGRHRQSAAYGFICLDIADAEARDSGLYTLRASNNLGEAECHADILIHPKSELLQYQSNLDVDDVREIQHRGADRGEPPKFLDPPRNFHCEQELGRSMFEARIQPINDPSLRVSWLKDGQPLPNANRIQTSVNFGVIQLSIHPTFPEDAGVYTAVLHNVMGTAQANAELSTYQSESLRLETQHEQSLPIIGYLDSHQVHIGPMPVDRPEEDGSLEAPRFARTLQDKIEVTENEPVHFEARIQPASDVKMRAEWYHNGHPLPAAHRFRPMFDFGYVALDILYAYPEDSGTYTLVARNELGECKCDLELTVLSEKSLYLDAQHPEGLQRIEQLENSRVGPIEEDEDRGCDNAPHFLGDLQDLQLDEHQDIHLDIKVTPVNDPTMTVEWFVNGHPLLTGSRVKAMYEFGFIALDVKGAISEDSGTYTVRAKNALGEATKECIVVVAPAGTILDGTQHEESLDKITHLEGLNKYGRTEEEDAQPDGPPQFILQLPGDLGEVEESEPLHLECQVRPYNDNSLKVYWLRDGRPLPTGHRFRTFYDFGYVSLDILGVHAADAGEYSCVAENSLGQAVTTTSFTCNAKEGILGQTQHPASYQRIQELEAPKEAEAEEEEQPHAAPSFLKPIGPDADLEEGQSIYIEAQVSPADDNTMTYEWFLNGHPLMKAHRYALSQDFGYAALNILYCYPEDEGEYTLVARNATGEAKCSMYIRCSARNGMLIDSLHPSSLARITELETPQQRAEPAPDAPKEAPRIVQGLPSGAQNVHESQTLHLEAQVSPIDDNQMRYEWFFNGFPLKASSRYRMANDFGYISLDIDYVIAEDEGDYTLRVSNAAGQVETNTSIQVDRLGSIISETAHPESYRRIQELEALRPAKPTDEDAPPEAPSFTQQLQGPQEVLKEGQSVHLDCVVQPINDPRLKIEWYHEGLPLQFGSRIRTIHDFGYVGLEFLHVHPEDSGTYTCRAVNNAGEATTQITLECRPKKNIYLESQHEESWQKIQELENREVPREPSPDQTFPPPTFTQPLQDVDQPAEGSAVRLEALLQPVFWTLNGTPLENASRFMPQRHLDLIHLDILGISARDSGEYVCRAVSAFGEAETRCNVTCDPTASLLLDPNNEQSWQRVQDIENRPVPEAVEEEANKVAPKFVVPLAGSLGELQEGVPIHLECQVEPTNDNQLIVEWYHDGAPLANGHRFRTRHDFGYVALDILYAFAQDSGEWSAVARNALGEAVTQTSFTIQPRGTLYLDTQHPDSWKKIQEIEAPRAGPEELADAEHDAPQFVEPMESLERIEFQSAHFQTRVTPMADPKMRFQWLKDGAPLANSNRMKLTSDFGYVALDIAHTVPEDSGTYTVVASNEKGEAKVEATLAVTGNAGILDAVQNAASWQRIQEIEAPRAPEADAPDAEHAAPRWVRQLNSNNNVIEGQPAHFEAQFAPFADPNTVVEWKLNGAPLGASNRRVLRNDFGLVTLDLQYVLAEDSGKYECTVSNKSGTDTTQGELSCEGRPSIYGDTQHAQSWQKIQEIEAPRGPAEEAPAKEYAKPTFTQGLQSVDGVEEGGVALLEARYQPVDDPTLKLEWFLNDAPLGESNWISTTRDFGTVTLRISPAHERHSGVYSCKASNAQGAAVTSAQVTVRGAESLLLDTSHPESLRKIQEMEAFDKFARIEAPEREFDKPQFIQGFENWDDVQEGQVVELHGLVEPSGDPSMRVEWLLNGQPLMNSNRFRKEYEFGNVILTIVHLLPHDSGVYTCRVWNAQGEATTSATVKAAGYERILADSQHPASWQRIQEIEAPKVVVEVEEETTTEKPYFIQELQSVEGVVEGSPVHLEATFQPARDPELTVSWERNGYPLLASQLVQTRHELGWATLDILSVNPDHEGIYTFKIQNSQGEAASSAAVKVEGTSAILGDTRHEESWKRIQEIEAPRAAGPDEAPAVYDAPEIRTQLEDVECEEGARVHLEAQIQPVNDPGLKVQWLRNGTPLAHGSKYAISHDFGICQLDIGYTYPEDAGVYQLRIWNERGEAVSSCTVKCSGKDAILGDTQHEESWKRIQEIEAPKEVPEEVDAAPKPAPRFITSIQSPPGELHEGQPAHFEATLEPIDDPQMRVEWFLNGAPVGATSRVKTIQDFGWAILDINHVETRDAGDWKCVATNQAGSAECQCSLQVVGKDGILGDALQPQSLQRIQEIEAPKPLPEDLPEQAAEKPEITSALASTGEPEEGGAIHLQATFSPTNDPRIRVEWLLDGHPVAHSNRHRILSDFGFAVLHIINASTHDSGEYTLRVSNEAGEASSSTTVKVEGKSGLLLGPQSEQKAAAVEQLEERLHRHDDAVIDEEKEVMPVFVEPLNAPQTVEEGDRAHFSARYEPINDNHLQVQWYHDGRPVLTGSRVKMMRDFGYCVLELSPVYAEDAGEYTLRAVNRVGEAVTSTSLTCAAKDGIISGSQLPNSMSGAQARIAELEAPRAAPEDAPDVEHGPPKFTTQLVSPPELQEGDLAHLEVQVFPVADPRLRIEWFHEGQPMRDSNRMRQVTDFGFVVLDIRPAEPQDSGVWRCVATNDYGSAECEAEIKVVPTGGVFAEWQSPAERKQRIDQLEEWIHRPKEELSLPSQEFEAPHFTQELADLGTLGEGEATAFVCVLEPIGDPTLRVEWKHNGHSIPYSNRISTTNEFGVATLLIKHLIAQDTGDYECVATNSKGQAVTTGRVQVESPEAVDAPQVVQPLVSSIDNVAEGDSVHLEARILPTNDPNLKVRWLRDGQPLPEASRFRPSFEFGFASLDILYAYPEDSGEYVIEAKSDKGEVTSKCLVTVLAGRSLEFSPQAHGSLQENLESHFRQHSIMELKLTVEDAYDEQQQRAPEFKTKLQNIGVAEGEFCRFETQVAPINDPYMRLEWFKDKRPVVMGHRFRSTLDFGFAALDLLYALPDDTGEYTCVASNRHGHAMISAKLACQGASHVVTQSQMPQGMSVTGLKKNQQQLYWSETQPQQARTKQAPQFTIKPRNTQVDENMPARFECAVVGNPKPKVTWFINGNQALHGHRHKLNYDGLYYLTIPHSRVSDAGEVMAIARNSEGEVLASCSLDVFPSDDFRNMKLKPAKHTTAEELHEREKRWHVETMGSLGVAFKSAPKADAQKLMHVERARSPIEPLESEELIQKFARSKEEMFEKLGNVEGEKKTFEGMKLEDVSLRAGRTNRFEPTKEKLPTVNLKAFQGKKQEQPSTAKPGWAQDGGQKLAGANENKFKRVEAAPKEIYIPARDQVNLQTAKPTRAEKVEEGEHVRIAEEKAKMRQPQQGPLAPKEAPVVHKDQVKMKQQQPQATKEVQHVVLEEKELKGATVNQKPEIPEARISNKPEDFGAEHRILLQTYRERSESLQTTSYDEELHLETDESTPQPTKLAASQKAAPSLSQQLIPLNGEVGKGAKFVIAFGGDAPVKVTWLKDGKELKSTFRHQITTSNGQSQLAIGRLESSHQGEYTVRLENAAGMVESSASLSVGAAPPKGTAPDFKAKDGQPLPFDGRFIASEDGNTHRLVCDAVLAPDAGVYECVAKNTAGEARCKAKLNINLAKTGKGAEEGPRLEAPRFTAQIQPIVANEGQAASFTAKFSGFPEPTIRWYRNNEPIKKSGYSVSQKDGTATLTIQSPRQEDVAEYKVEASNPAGKASSVANLVLAPRSGRVTTRTLTGGSTVSEASVPQFVSKLSDISARQGHTVKFSVEIGGDPLPTVQWYHNGRQLMGGRDVKITVDGLRATLELTRVSAANAGTYECRLKNPKGEAKSTAQLNLSTFGYGSVR
ncbi:unnamed protein product, partial [Mesorhabditis spiculigera]